MLRIITPRDARRTPTTARRSEWRDLPALRWTRLGILALVAVGYVVEVLWVHHVGAWLLGAGGRDVRMRIHCTVELRPGTY